MKFIITLLISFMLTQASLAYAGPYKLARKMGHQDMSAIYDQLGLSSEQKAQLEENRNKYHPQMKSLHQRKKALRQELNEELQNPNWDQQKVQSLQKELQDVRSNLGDMRLQGLNGMRNILTPAQYEEFHNLTQ